MNGINHQTKTGRRKTAQRKYCEQKKQTKTKTKTNNQNKGKGQENDRYFKNLSLAYKINMLESQVQKKPYFQAVSKKKIYQV